jgi:polysaccharide deacetylase family protein (PEP-CTERM system associated)
MLNALTIDVEDYYMVSAFADVVSFEEWGSFESRLERSTFKVLDILDEQNVKATFFTLGWVAEHHPGVVREIHARGHEVASHGYNHRLAYELSPEEFREDTRRSKGLIEGITGEAVEGYRAASYSITKKSLWALDILIEEGFVYDSSIFPIYHDRYGLPGFSRFPQLVSKDGAGELLEIPLTTVRILGKNLPVAGGGYLRLFPLSLVKWGIRRLNEHEGEPAVIYIHPWELDPEQPRLDGSRLSAFRHTVNLEKTASKVTGLIKAFEFGPVREVFSSKLDRMKK